MTFTRILTVAAAGASLALGGCGGGGEDKPATSASAAPSTAATASASASASPSSTAEAAAPTGTLTTTPVKCTQVELPAGLKQAGVNPVDGPMCAYESDTDYVSFQVGARLATSFKVAKVIEQGQSEGKIVIEPVAADGWTFGARWPANGPSVRVQYWLVDGTNQVLLCKMGTDRGEGAIAELADVCEQAKAALYTA